ncbi:MAG: hypothetical protein RIE08_09945 [Acidimicrobiales bacterium]
MAPAYFVTALADHDPQDSAFHAAVRQRAAATGERGWQSVRDEMAAATGHLREVGLENQPPIRVLDGLAMEVDDYLRTRLVELCVHCTDLADSLGCDPPELPDQAWSEVARVVGETAILRNGPTAFTLALSRPGRFGPAAAF